MMAYPNILQDADSPGAIVPVAIVGMSLEFPGNSSSADSFWSLLMSGRCASDEFPPERLNGSSLYHPDPTRGMSIPVRCGHFIDRPVDVFDAPFFGLSAAETLAIDPQCRALLETTYRALENAGLTIAGISNSNTSVYTGSLSNDFTAFTSKDLEQGSRYSLVGMPSLLAGRLSWFFNLTGPSITIDTACSSSLVALDLGCQSLYSGTSNMSIVTGSSLIFSEDLFHMLSNMGMLSPDGKSYSFDHRANGYGRGEGIAALIIKRLPDALRDGDTIRGIIRSTGTNSDGHTPNVTQPSKTSQTSLIQQTYEKAGLSMRPTRYFEAHGTGTPIGDPMEANAIGAAFRGVHPEGEHLYTGSVKSNIGHLEGASGLAGVIKTILILEQGMIPPNANFEKINPRIDEVGLNIKIPTEATPWPTGGLRRASVNSFGASGTNAHVVLDDVYHFLQERGLHGNHYTRAEPAPPRDQPVKSNGRVNSLLHDEAQFEQTTPRLLLLSASDEGAMKRVVELYQEWLKGIPMKATDFASFLDNFTYTLNSRRTRLPYKSFAVVENIEELRGMGSQMSHPLHSLEKPHAAFIFTGQGAQWAGMGKELLKFSMFREQLLESNEYLKSLGCQWDIIGIVFPLYRQMVRFTKRGVDSLSNIENKGAIDRPSLSQTLCTILQVAICDLYRILNICPITVVGHSSGEIAAAYCTGALSRESAWKVAYFRGMVSESLAEKYEGGMMAVGMPAAILHTIIEEIAPSLTIACINSPESVTVSGDRAQLQILTDALASGTYGSGIFQRRLKVQVAYHSSQMSSVAEEYRGLLGVLEPGESEIRPRPTMISSVTGKLIEPCKMCNVEYWIQNMLQPVRFSDAVVQMVSQPSFGRRKKLDGSHRPLVVLRPHVLVEIGPHSALQGPVRSVLKQTPAASGIKYYSALKRDTPADRTTLAVVGQLSCHGFSVDLARANELHRDLGEIRQQMRFVLHTLPEYPFNHSDRYWSNARLGQEYRYRRHAKLDLLGKPVIDWNPLEARWTNFLKLSEIPWAADHKINGSVIYPAVGVFIMAAEAAKQLAQSNSDRPIKGYRLSKGYFLTALVIPTSAEGIETHLHLRPPQDDANRDCPSWEYDLYSCQNGQWHKNSHGTIVVEYETPPNKVSVVQEELEWLRRSRNAHKNAEATAKSVMSRANFYKSLWKSGYTFGPAFRAMDNVTFSDDNGWESTADVRCFDWHAVDNSNHYQEHIVHPTTLDGVIQTSLAVMAQGGAGVSPTAVPIEVENFWVSSTGLAYPQAEMVKSKARLLSKGITGYESSVTALDSTSGKVLLYAKRFRLKFVTATGSTHVRDRNPHMCYHLQWKPDVDLFKTSNALDTLTLPQGSNEIRGDRMLEIVKSYLEIATFKNPNMHILHISAGRNDRQHFLLEQFFAPNNSCKLVLPHGLYTLVDLAGMQQRDELRREYDGLTIYASESLYSGRLGENTFDLVILSRDSDRDANACKYLPHAVKLLKPGGRLIQLEIGASLRTDERCNVLHEDKDTISGSRAFDSKMTAEISLEEETHMKFKVFRKLLRQQLEPLPMRFVLIIDDVSQAQQEVSDCLVKELQQIGHRDCEVNSLDKVKSIDSEIQTTYIFLIEMERPLLEDISSEEFLVLKEIIMKAKGILWLTAREKQHPLLPSRGIVDGLARVVRAESNRAVFVSASLEKDSIEKQVNHIITVVRKTAFGCTDQNYESAYSQDGGNLNICRVVPTKDTSSDVFQRSLPEQSKPQAFGTGPPLLLTVAAPGLLDSLQWVEDTSYYEDIAADEVEVKVQAIGLNFRDLLFALGRINGTTLGTDCAGIVTRAGRQTEFKAGDRVALFTPTAFATYTRIKAAAVARVPTGVNFFQAASVPSQFVAAWDALQNLAKLKKGETILIHSGAGGTGQAAIQIAQHLGAEIITTVGSAEKKRFITEHYGIPEDHILYSRDTSFADGIRRMTNDRGVDVILNSLAGENLVASWELIAPYGRFIEIGKKDIDANNNLPMGPFMRGATFVSLDVASKSHDMPLLVKHTIEGILNMFQRGIFHPAQPLHVLSISDIEKGMRLLQEGNLSGKVVFEISHDAVVPTTLKTTPCFFFDKEKTYVIAGGTGGLGLATARWMVEERGARSILLLSRSGLQRDEVIATVAKLRETGARIEAPPCDICDVSKLRAVLDNYKNDMPPIGGCIQAAMVLRDTLLANMTHSDWKVSTATKTTGSWNLHTLLPKGQDFFVLLSSVAGILGSAGQANYAAGNTYLDSLARYRVSKGERAVSLNLGVMLENGFLASKTDLRERILTGGFLTGVTPSEFFAVLDKYCNPSQKVLNVDESQLIIGLAPPSKILKRANKDFPFPTLPFYQHILHRASNKTDEGLDGLARNRQQFIAAETLEEAGAIVSRAFLERLVSSMPASAGTLEDGTAALLQPIRVFGVDSLLAIELRGWFAKEFGADIPIFEILGEGTILAIGLSASGKSSLRSFDDS
ncbi:hypothetical protein HYALB_00011015 [Hymenoscyphus albidus]|uniref:Polyketide synthase n=1 Tax=Hymenoscyphus albidus TaxID=595503 RepID=A0A9N9LLT6_9HELO|nr:hypothetical protein HYALB_00011015 [Hymenoscyphus albidus]